MKQIKFDDLLMIATSGENYSLNVCIASGVATFDISIKLNHQDFAVIAENYERAALLQAAFHRPFQLEATALSEKEQRHYLDIILHGSKATVAAFLTERDLDSNGAISNMLRITCDRDPGELRKGHWFL